MLSISMEFQERQLTIANKGHTIHHIQVFSKDDCWIVYDTRNHDSHIKGTGSIEMVHVETGAIKVLYTTDNQTEHGPGVGAATFSPTLNRVIFIHGIRNADRERPYGMTRRTGVAIDLDRPQQPLFMDARDITPPYTEGALRGGTHAHSWSGDGQWLSFTYNDQVMADLSETDPTRQDLRMVGVMVPGQVKVANTESLENNDGIMFSVVVSSVSENPAPNSGDIDKAFDECWIGKDGYFKLNGEKQKRAIAFQGNVRDHNNSVVTEVFVIDLPENLIRGKSGFPLQGTESTRPHVPEGIVQRRITFTEKGIEGPRHWLRSKADGSLIAFLAKDKSGVVQVFGVSPNGGGSVQQLTFNMFPVQGPFNVSPDGNWLAFPADNSIFLTDLTTNKSVRITERFSDKNRPVGAPVWSNNGDKISYNRYIETESGRFLQIFLLKRVS